MDLAVRDRYFQQSLVLRTLLVSQYQSFTYFISCTTPYHINKFDRFPNALNVLGEDHKLQSNLLLIVAWISILLSLLLCVVTQQGYGALLFCGFMGVSVLIITIFYNFIDKLIKPFSFLNMLLIGLSGLLLAVNSL